MIRQRRQKFSLISQMIALLWILGFVLSTFVVGQVGYTYGAKILGTKVHFVIVNPFASGLQITPVYIPNGTRFNEIVKNYRPLVAINGTFFNPKTKHPIGDIVIRGKHIYRQGKLRTALVVQGPFAFIMPISLDMNFEDRVDSLLACGPRLLTDEIITVSPRAEGFKDSRLFYPARRSAIGITESGKIVFAVIVTPVTLTKAAKIMKALGCTDAMNLDGGGSSALYCNGKYFVYPNRPLVTTLIVTKTFKLQPVKFFGR